ncbi:MAG: hypothetical protein K5656_00170 [Lachnospiraceae bacterium]|nr:hypothetical protein [Lachnospiraceae bacterium]
MNKNLAYIEEFVSLAMLSDLMMMILLTLMQFDVQHKINYFALLLVPIYLIIIYFVNSYITKIYLALPILIAAGFLVIPFSNTRAGLVFNIIVVVIIFIAALYSRSADNRLAILRTPIEAIILFVAMFLFAKHYDIDSISRIIFIAALVYLFFGLVEIYLNNLVKYLDNTRGSSELALNSLIKTDSTVFSCFIGLIFIGLIIILIIPDNFIEIIKNFFLNIITKIVNAILFLISLTGSIKFQSMDIDFGKLVKDVKPILPREFWLLPEFILKAIIVIVSIRIIYGFIKAIANHLVKYRGLEYDKITFSNPSASKKKSNIKVKKENNKLSKYNARDRVRLFFIKLVREHEYTYKHLYKNATPKSIVKTMELEELSDYGVKRDYSSLREVYEKARYSNEPIKREDLAKMKKS